MIRDNYLNIKTLVKNRKVMRLFKVVAKHGGVLRFVGGAVRDALKGIEGGDIDFATDLSPDELVEACNEEGLKTVAIGIKFGTVGVVIDDQLLEVTSLRKDIKTDGCTAFSTFTRKVTNCKLWYGFLPGASKFTPVFVPNDQLQCLPLPFTPPKGFSWNSTRN